jgi:hypothetical protein
MVVKNLLFFALFIFCVGVAGVAIAQDDRKDKTPVTYEELYDEPYSIKKLFVQFQPLYGELFATNVNGGFGLEASFYPNEKVDFKAMFRTTYTSNFFDFNREQALRNGDVDNTPKVFTYFELGGTYHVKDFESSSKTKMFLYKKSYKGNKWASRVPLNAEIPCKVRKVQGVRLGGIVWGGTVDVNRIMERQDITLEEFKDTKGETTLNDAVIDPDNFRDDKATLFTNVSTAGLYLGGSMSWIKNVAVSFDKFESGLDDLIFTTYFDLLYSPKVTLEDMVYSKLNDSGIKTSTSAYDISPIKVSKFGFRAGIEGKFNRTLSWSYGGEVGLRPGIQKGMFYALLKISFPVFGTNLDYKVESFGK